jgi:hypothetical protein
MKHNVMLTVASLFSILFMTSHLTDDIVRVFTKQSREKGVLNICVNLLLHYSF